MQIKHGKDLVQYRIYSSLTRKPEFWVKTRPITTFECSMQLDPNRMWILMAGITYCALNQ